MRGPDPRYGIAGGQAGGCLALFFFLHFALHPAAAGRVYLGAGTLQYLVFFCPAPPFRASRSGNDWYQGKVTTDSQRVWSRDHEFLNWTGTGCGRCITATYIVLPPAWLMLSKRTPYSV